MLKCTRHVISLAFFPMLIFMSVNLAFLAPFRESFLESGFLSQIHISLPAHFVSAATASIASIANGKKIKVNGIQFIKIGNNIFMATGKVNCTGTNVDNSILPNSSGKCTCLSGYATDTSGTNTVANGGSCSLKKCGTGTTGTYVNYSSGTCTCASGKYSNSSGGTTIGIATGVCSYNKYCTGSYANVQYATSQPTCTCQSGHFANSSGGTNPGNTGACSYNKYCTGSYASVQYATSQPTCTCQSGHFANSSGSTNPGNTAACNYNKYCTGSYASVQYATSQPTCYCQSGHFANSSGGNQP